MIDIISVEPGNIKLENQRTLKMMKKCGMKNVRGGKYTYVEIWEHMRKKMQKQLNDLETITEGNYKHE